MSESEFEAPVIGKGWINLVIILICVFFLLKSCSYINRSLGVKDDGIVEQIGERLIERKLGLERHSLDFTPNGPVYPPDPE